MFITLNAKFPCLVIFNRISDPNSKKMTAVSVVLISVDL